MKNKLSFNWSYIFIPALVVVISYLGRVFTESGMEWYDSLIQPALTPPNYVFGIAWTFIYVCATISALIIWNTMKKHRREAIMFFFVVNAILNVLWSYIFFVLHEPRIAITEMFFLEISVAAIMYEAWRHGAKLASLLLLPYLLWVGFATYLTHAFMMANGL